MRRFRWWLSGRLESISKRFEWWAECVAPPYDGPDLSEIMKMIDPTDTPFLRSIDRKSADYWKSR